MNSANLKHTPASANEAPKNDLIKNPERAAELATEIRQASLLIKNELGQQLSGQGQLIDYLLIALLTKGHALLSGPPGVAKTLLLQNFANIFHLENNYIQFTADLSPLEIIGKDLLDTDDKGKQNLRFAPGPIFSNIIIADELNHAAPRTQAALLQAMQEERINFFGRTYLLQLPFNVFATQNSTDEESVYALTPGVLDRFLFKLELAYPEAHEEFSLLKNITAAKPKPLKKLLSAAKILEFQEVVPYVPITDNLVQLVLNILRATRPHNKEALSSIKEFVRLGASPRAGIHLIMAAKARALIAGRTIVDSSDIYTLALPVLKHRLLLNLQGIADKVETETLLKELLKTVPAV